MHFVKETCKLYTRLFWLYLDMLSLKSIVMLAAIEMSSNVSCPSIIL